MTQSLPLIFITGCPRSGTSLVAGVVHICGAWGGEMFGPTAQNRKGFFENRFVRETLVKGYLRRLGVDPLGQRSLPDIDHLQPEPDWAERFEAAMRREGYRAGPRFVKDVKSCLFWPVWRDAFPEARWLIVRRPAAEIAASCSRTPFLHAHDAAEGWAAWIAHHNRCLDQIEAGCRHVRSIASARIVAGDLEEIRAAIAWCGLTWREDAVREFIEPALWRGARDAA